MNSARSIPRVFLLLAIFVQMSPRVQAQEKQDFNRKIVPLLVEHCLECHSGSRPKGGLDLTRARTTLQGGKSGPALVPGKAADSLLWQRIDAGEMPPRKGLSAQEKAVFQAWINAGAVWGLEPIDPFRVSTSKRAGYDWWSLQPVPKLVSVPKVQDKDRPRQPLDFFILARLEERGLKPSPEADRRTLIRRLSFDLLGLPPPWEEVAAFVVDDRPDAYERLVDRLLASPHYGEHWARHWLDVVRYGESDGFERNAPRQNAWPYRDWVIDALNQDLPYDEFCRLQIAGDILRPDDPEAIKATGYLVAGIHNTVLPNLKSLKDAAFQDELEDLVGNVSQTFLGMTAHCARCHDHKFDPIAQKDYYRLASALSGVQPGERSIALTSMKEELAKLTTQNGQLNEQLTNLEDPIRKAILTDRRQGKAPKTVPPRPLAAWDFREGPKDRIGTLHASLEGGARLTQAGLVLDGKTAFARTAPLANDLREKTLEAWVRLDNLEQRGGGVLTVQTTDGTVFDALVFGERDPGCWLAGSDFFRRTASFQGPVETEAKTQPVHLAITYQADGTITGYRNSRPYGKAYQSKGLVTFPKGKAVVAFGIRHTPPGGNKMLAGAILQARLYDRALSKEEIAVSAEVDDFVAEAEITQRLTPEQRQQRETLLSQRAALLAQINKLQEQTQALKVYAIVPKQPETTRLLQRGQVSEPGEVVAPGGLPAVGGAYDFGLPADVPEGQRRLKLAHWLTQPDNPLLARVMVNRLWHHHFGVGLVETPNDFGFNGGRPSHPELLDWLAAEFRARKFRLKDMHRLIVTSSTYRQASRPRPEGLKADADGRLLWRKKPQRMAGEMLRDSLLAVAGLLNAERGGKGFSDYQKTDGAGTTYYEPIDPIGPLYQRRSIYRFVPRGANQGLLDVFDCPDPAAAAPRRNATTTPLQALALWNGSLPLRLAEALAERITREEPRDADLQIQRAYQMVLQRNPAPEELARARRLVQEFGLRSLNRALFNSNEFLTIE